MLCTYPRFQPSTVNGVRLVGCFDEFSIQRPIAKRLDPEDHRLFEFANSQNFPPSSSSSAVGVGPHGERQPLLRCLGPEQRSNLAERSRRSISLGPTAHSPTDFYFDAGRPNFRLSSTALADPPKEVNILRLVPYLDVIAASVSNCLNH
ncbi:unnamed protein product [Schistocephalus solidus]|uniref:Uncharacterized protein n=1 Tax=Schistocephalus solidus TaxID=70667 RepID=A0A183SWR1_SCHSO|nr:unnamed protein product [Schistocephalus solidus]